MQRSDLAAAFHRGDYAGSLALIGDQPKTSSDARVLLDIGLRRRDFKLVYQAAEYLRELGNKDEREVGRAYAAYARRALGYAASRLVAAVSDRRCASDIAYVNALVAWMGGDYSQARSYLRSTLPATAEQRVKYMALQSWLGVSLERQAHLLLGALTQALTADVDVGLIGNIAHPLAVLVRELELGDLAARAEELLRGIQWGPEATADRFYAERALGWNAAMHGDYIDGLQRVDRAAYLAPEPAQRALVAIDRMRICQMAGDATNVHVAASIAFLHFEEIAWDNPEINDEPFGLYGAADVLAPVDRERTLRLLHQADCATPTLALGAAHAAQLEALRNLAHAFVSTDERRALTLARQAYRTFHAIGYAYRAATAALRAYDMSGVKHWLDKAAAYAERYPRSVFARAVVGRTSALRHVTPRRRELLEAIAANLTNKEIADRLAISENTVKEHIRMLHHLFGVKRRSELIAAWRALQRAA